MKSDTSTRNCRRRGRRSGTANDSPTAAARRRVSSTGSNYASFHAAQAVLYDRGVAPSSHGAVRCLFGEHVVMDGSASRAQGRLLTTLGDLRQQADYGYEPLEVDVETLFGRTRAFVEAMGELVDG